MAEAKIGLTIYLLKPDRVPAFDSEVRQGNNVRPLAAPLDGDFIQLPSAGGEPTWGDAIRAVLQNATGLNFDSLSPAGLLVVRRAANTFVVTFGHAWQKVEHHWTEPQFGLRVALNSIPLDKVIELRAEQVFAKWHIASERAPRASFVEEFGVEFDRDFVGFMEGVLGKTVRGGTNLRVKAELSRLGAVLDRAAVQFHSTQYKKRWPEIGYVRPVNDAALNRHARKAIGHGPIRPADRSEDSAFHASREARGRIGTGRVLCLWKDVKKSRNEAAP